MSTGTTYRAGEVLDITIRARVTEDSNKHHCLKVTYRQPEELNAAPYPMTLPLRSPDMTITRVVPAEWPPQPGDLWRNRRGAVWFTYHDPRGVVAMVPTHPDSDSRYEPDWLLRQCGPLTLVHREPTGGER